MIDVILRRLETPDEVREMVKTRYALGAYLPIIGNPLVACHPPHVTRTVSSGNPNQV
jgi:hypothetical protein